MHSNNHLNFDLGSGLLPVQKSPMWLRISKVILFWGLLIGGSLLVAFLVYKSQGMIFMEKMQTSQKMPKKSASPALIFNLPPFATTLKTSTPSEKGAHATLQLSLELNLPHERELLKLVQPKVQQHIAAYLREIQADSLTPQSSDLELIEKELCACVDSVIKPLKIKALTIKSVIVE